MAQYFQDRYGNLHRRHPGFSPIVRAGLSVGRVASSRIGRQISGLAGGALSGTFGAGYTAGRYSTPTASSSNEEMMTRSGRRLRRAPFRRRTRRRLTYGSIRARPYAGVSTNYGGASVQYRKKRSLKRGRGRRSSRITRVVKKVLSTQLGTRSAIFGGNVVNNDTGSPTSVQLCQSFCLYGTSYASGTQQDGDLLRIAQAESAANVAQDPNEAAFTGKLLFRSAVMEITCQNFSYTTAEPQQTPFSATLAVDVYEVTARRKFDSLAGGGGVAAGGFNDIASAFTVGGSQQTAIASAGGNLTSAPVNLSTFGTTPWDFPPTLSEFGVKIWKKTRFILRGGESFTYLMKGKKHRSIAKNVVEDNVGGNMPGWTRWCIIIARLAPGDRGSAGATAWLACSAIRKYTYNRMSLEGDWAGIMTT